MCKRLWSSFEREASGLSFERPKLKLSIGMVSGGEGAEGCSVKGRNAHVPSCRFLLEGDDLMCC